MEAEEVAEDVRVGQNNYEEPVHAEALLIFYSVRKWREIRREDNPTPSAGHTIHTQQSNRVKER